MPAAAREAGTHPQATAFDATTCGRVTGRVVWNGPVPSAPEFIYGVPLSEGSFDIRSFPNPNRPAIDEKTQSLAGAVVFLRSIDATRAKPWDLPAIRVELKDRNIHIIQGDASQRVGFVRLGDSVSMASAEPVFHSLRGRGASYFTFPFPEPHQPMSRIFDKPGIVELTSGAGFYWANAHLFIVEHSYYTITDTEGRFTLNQVPDGDGELVVWHPGWTVTRQERDPESGMIFRQSYGPSLEAKYPIAVVAGQSQNVTIAIP
jgi:hypothetical protein